MACGMEHQIAACCSMRAMLTSPSFLKPFAHLKGEREWELLVAHDGAPPHRNAVPSASLTTLHVVSHCPSNNCMLLRIGDTSRSTRDSTTSARYFEMLPSVIDVACASDAQPEAQAAGEVHVPEARPQEQLCAKLTMEWRRGP